MFTSGGPDWGVDCNQPLLPKEPNRDVLCNLYEVGDAAFRCHNEPLYSHLLR